MIGLSEPKMLFKRGHTLSLIKHHDKFFGYLGHVLFSGVDIYSGPSVYSMEKVGSLKGRRWGSAIVKDDRVFLFATQQKMLSRVPFVNPYEHQQIFLLESDDGKTFGAPKKVLDGSAPSIYEENGSFYLFFHRRNPHRILFRKASDPRDMSVKSDSLLLTDVENTLSAPSLAFFDNTYWLACEFRRKSEAWKTVLFKSKTLSNFQLQKEPLLENGACAFQHIFGDRYVLTYSEPDGKGGWKMMINESQL
jgi:hypothetical protein